MRLATKYLGLELDNPLVPSASPLSRDVDTVKLLEDSGAPAIVLYSLFEEEIQHEDDELNHYIDIGSDSFSEASSFFPTPTDSVNGADRYLEHIQKLKNMVDIPIIGSLNGITTGGWINYAKKMQEAGADALELNVFYLPTEPTRSNNDIENIYVDCLSEIVKQISIPVAMKINPYFSNLPAFCKKLEDAGAKALVLFNRFYQPDIDINNLEVSPVVHLSTSADNVLPLRWIAILKDQLNIDLASSTGVHTAEDVIKLTMAGADVTMVASSLLKNGPKYLSQIKEELIQWMDEFEYKDLNQMRASMSLNNVPNKNAFVRSNYIKMLNDFKPLK